MTADYEKAFRWACRAFYADPDSAHSSAAQTVVGVLATRLRRRGWTEERIAEAVFAALALAGFHRPSVERKVRALLVVDVQPNDEVP